MLVSFNSSRVESLFLGMFGCSSIFALVPLSCTNFISNQVEFKSNRFELPIYSVFSVKVILQPTSTRIELNSFWVSYLCLFVCVLGILLVSICLRSEWNSTPFQLNSCSHDSNLFSWLP